MLTIYNNGKGLSCYSVTYIILGGGEKVYCTQTFIRYDCFCAILYPVLINPKQTRAEISSAALGEDYCHQNSCKYWEFCSPLATYLTNEQINKLN